MPKDKLKIAVDARELRCNQLTGIGRFLKLFLGGIRLKAETDMYLLAEERSDLSFYKGCFNVIKAKSLFRLWYDQVTIAKILDKEGIDIFFSPYYKTTFLSKCRKIITIHDLHFLEDNVRKGAWRFKPFITYLKQATAAAYKIITVSNFTKAEILKRLDIKEDKIKVVYNGIDNRFRVLSPDARRGLSSKYGINYEYILYVGNMMPSKNLKGLIEAYSLSEQAGKYKLIIIAKKDGNFKGLLKIIKRLSLEGNILFIDFLPDDDLALFYNCAKVFVFPSFYEGFGLPPLEAMACGAPVISSHTTSLKEILEDNVLYVNPYDIKDISRKLSDLLSNDGLRDTLKGKGLMHSKKFSPEVFADRLFVEITQGY